MSIAGSEQSSDVFDPPALHAWPAVHRFTVEEYQRLVEAHLAQAVTIQNSTCPSAGGAEAVQGMYWVCPD